jgi:two-component system NtrC family response regulator
MSAHRKTVLVADADGTARERLSAPLKREYRVLKTASAESAIESLEREEVDILIVDADLPGVSGFDLLLIVRENFPLIETVLTSDSSDVEQAVRAVKHGAYHFLDKSVDPDALRSIVGHAAERRDLNRRVLTLADQVGDLSEKELVTGSSPAMREVLDAVHRVARLPMTVLLLGESGTGKELLARRLHHESAHPGGPFVAVNMAAIPRDLIESTLFGHEKGSFTGALQQRIGKFELANGGTLFLDEVGDLPLELQAKLLRAIQEAEIERVGGNHAIRTTFRLVAATNTDLDQAVKDGRFRADLYYRLKVMPIKLPPLRERIEDLPALANFFLHRHSQRFHKPVEGIAATTLRLLSNYWWPGNVRELENLMERLVATVDHPWIIDEDLPFELHIADLDRTSSDTGLLERALTTFERNFLIRALERNGWNVTAAARYLGVPLSTLKFKMERLDVRNLKRRLKGES